MIPFKWLPVSSSVCILYLPHYSTLAGHPKAKSETYIQHDLTKYFLTEHRRRCVRTCTRMSLMRQEQSWNDAQAERSALPNCRTSWVCGQWCQISTCHHNNRRLLDISTSDSYRQDQPEENSDNALEQLGHALLNTFIRTDWRWAPVWEQIIYNSTPFSWNEEAHHDNLPPADKLADWTL